MTPRGHAGQARLAVRNGRLPRPFTGIADGDLTSAGLGRGRLCTAGGRLGADNQV